MGAYTTLKPAAKEIVDAVFTGTSLKQIQDMNLPAPWELDRSLAILYPDDPGFRDDVRADYRVSVAAQTLGKTMLAGDIGRELGQNPKVVKKWVAGASLGALHTFNRNVDYEIPTEESVEFASFLGFMMGRRGKHTKIGNLIVASTAGRVVKVFEDTVRKLWDVRCRKLDDKDSNVKHKVLYSRKLGNYIKLVTDDYTTLPWEHLHTKAERMAFLKAWLSNSSSILNPSSSHKAIVQVIEAFRGEGKPGILQDLQLLLWKLGFGSSLVGAGEGRYAVRVFDLDDLQKLADEKLPDGTQGYFIQKEKRQRLHKALRKSQLPQKKDLTFHNYFLFRQLVDGGMTVRAAAGKLHLDAALAKGYIMGAVEKPPCVKLYDELRALDENRRPDEIGYAFRNLTHDSVEARKLAQGNNIEELHGLKIMGEIQEHLRVTAHPLLPKEYDYMVSSSGVDGAKSLLEQKRGELERRMRELGDRLMLGEETAVVDAVGQLPEGEVLGKALIQLRSGKTGIYYKTIKLDQIAAAVAVQPQLLERLLKVKMPVGWRKPTLPGKRRRRLPKRPDYVPRVFRVSGVEVDTGTDMPREHAEDMDEPQERVVSEDKMAQMMDELAILQQRLETAKNEKAQAKLRKEIAALKKKLSIED